MRRTRTWLCLVVMLVAGAVAAPTAWGAEYEIEGLPEFGHCVPAETPHTGEYKGKNCLAPAAGKGTYNWQPGPGPKPKFEGQLSKFKLETVGKTFTIECSFGVAKGEYTKPKTATVLFELIGCVRPETEQKCQLTPLKEGEMELTFEGEPGFIRTVKPIVGLDLKPSSPIAIQCGLPPEVVTPVSVEGSAIGAIKPPNAARESFRLSYVAPGGKQNPEMFEGGVKDTLTQNWLDEAGSHSEQVGLTIIGVEEKPPPLIIENEEPIEIKAK
jgi:hypothetical protein